jgi:hypothetical protein
MVGSSQTARFVPVHPVRFDTASDFAIRGEGNGSIGITLYRDAARKKIVASGLFTPLKGLASEFRLFVPAGDEVGVIEVSADTESAFAISALSTAAKFTGVRLEQGIYSVDSTTSVRFSLEGKVVSAAMSMPSDKDASLVVGLATDGTARLTLSGGTDACIGAYEAAIRAVTPLAIPLAVFAGATSVMLEAASGIASLTMEVGAGAPLSDLYAVLASPAPKGDFSLYRWDIFPETLVFDFKDYDTQDRYLKRLAFFAEKPGFRGRLAGNNEIAPLHGWNAHDYSTRTLKAFYGKAEHTGFQLDPEELALLDILLQRGVLVRGQDGNLAEGSGAIISISSESPAPLRRLFIDHEASHAVLFQDAAYAKLAEGLWRALDNDSRWFWRLHFSWRYYDISDEYLMFNEMQSYLVQQSNRAVPGYYGNLVKRLIDAYPAYKDRLGIIAPDVIGTALGNAAALNRYLDGRFGISGGNFGRTRLLPNRD